MSCFSESVTVGTCSLCGGPVQVPKHCLSVVPPTPTCAKCGARPKQDHGPIIEMERPQPSTEIRWGYKMAGPEVCEYEFTRGPGVVRVRWR